MSRDKILDVVTEPARQRQVLYDVDVAVAGSGVCGTFAAIAAARCGAKTLVIDRFGSLGGNIGPGMIINGSMWGEADTTLPGGLAGIAKEFVGRVIALRVRPEMCYPEDAGIASHLAYDMMKQAGVEFLLSVYASDPIVEDNVVKGLFVESKSGRVAVRAKVTIDGTGEAEIARRAGVPMCEYLEPDEAYEGMIRGQFNDSSHPTFWNDTQILCIVAGVQSDAYLDFREQRISLTNEEKAWLAQHKRFDKCPASLVRVLCKGWENGNFPYDVEPAPKVRATVRLLNVDGSRLAYGQGVLGFRVDCRGAIDCSDAKLMSRMENVMRDLAFRMAAFYRKYVPGFEKCRLLACSAFLGMRGGPHIQGEHTLTPQECFDGRKCGDVLYRNVHEQNHGGEPSGFDVPYGICLPKNVDGLLVCGRGAAYQRRGHEPTGMRARPSMTVFGQTVGTAAAVAALDRVTPKNVDIKKVQRRLIADGIVLGEEERLEELGLK